MKIKTSELTGAALDWSVAKCEGRTIISFMGGAVWVRGRNEDGHDLDGWDSVYTPRFSWVWGGPIIEREGITISKALRKTTPAERLWGAWRYDSDNNDDAVTGPTPLIAAMRCYVASKLGDEVDVPRELL